MRRFHKALTCLALLAAVPAHAGIIVDLDATALPNGSLVDWQNQGSLGGTFTRQHFFHTPQVETVAGVRGVTLDGDQDWYVGPTAPESVTGNGSRAIYAWVYNPEHNVEETVVSWSRRGGPAGTHMALNHGFHQTWGAIAHWDAPDMSWNGTQEAGIWTCVAYSYDGATGEASIYTNGSLVERRLVGPLNTWALDTNGNPLPFVVGCENSSNGSRSNNNHPGSLTIAKIRIWDEPLNDAQVATTYNADAPTFGREAAGVPAGISAFGSDPSVIYRGDSAELTWSVFGAEIIDLDPLGTLDTSTTSLTVSPEETTTYTLTVIGSDGSMDTRSLTVTVLAGEPVAHDLSVSTPVDTSIEVTLSATDPNPPPEGLAWEISDPPSFGALTGEAPVLTYTPNEGFVGEDAFTFRASDGVNLSNTATVTIAVTPPPVAPSAVTGSLSAVPSDAGPGAFLAYLRSTDSNPGETHSYSFVEGAGDTHNAWFTIHGNQLLAGPDFSAAAGPLSVRIRTTDSSGLSHEEVLTFGVAAASPPTVVINELHYDPPDNARTEFIELHNPTDAAINIGGWAFTRGISYVFPGGTTIEAGGYLVVAQDPLVFLDEFGFIPLGPYTGRLAGEGETVTLSDGAGNVIDEVDYKDEFPWPIAASGEGPSMELIHPSLDNDLAGSWRSSVSAQGVVTGPVFTAASSGWSYRPGDSQPSAPIDAWRFPEFSEDGNWFPAQTPIGYGVVDNLPLNTIAAGMQGNYLSVFARKSFTLPAGPLPANLLLRYSADDGIIVWINGTEVARRNVSQAEPALGDTASAVGSEGTWYEVELTNAANFLREGENVVAVRLLNQSITSSDAGFDVELIRPAGIRRPSPGARNTVFSENAPPQIRQVAHSPQQPKSDEATTITAKVTDPHGVATVELHYQIVAPGTFIPAAFPRPAAEILANPAGERPVNPAFEDPANWTTLEMRDDGSGGDALAADGVFTAVLPPQPHRTLMRYRITVTDIPGASVRVPYEDDKSLNFAYFVYDGVPDYAARRTVDPVVRRDKIWPKELLTSVPVYHWLIRPEDMLTLQAYNSWEQFPNNADPNVLAARRVEDWEGAFVADGIVHDHVRVRLRGGNSRYGDFEGRFPRGKRHYKFKFNRGHHLQTRDENGRPHAAKRGSVAFNKMFGNKGGTGWGMPEEIGATLWRTLGVPTPHTHWAHFRVIDDAEEAPDQYHGDFWGLVQVVEEYDGDFLDAHNLTKGNLYKLSDWIWDAERQRRYQSPDMVRDGSEFDNIRDNLHGGQSAAWLQDHVNYDSWYRYSAVAEAIRHYDLFPYTTNERHALKNLGWYFEPAGGDPQRGICHFLPYDWDASFGPNWNNGWEHANNALYNWYPQANKGMPYIDKPQMKIEHRNVLREFRDLIWQPDQINELIDHRAAVIADLSRADEDRWRDAPVSAGTANQDPLAPKVQDMKNFCFTGWSGSTGPTVGPGGRAAYLDQLANSPDAGQLPNRPTIAFTGNPLHPVDGLSFSCSAFSDPQGSHTFAAMEWRIGRIHDPAAPAFDPAEDFVMEYTPVWLSGRLTVQQNAVAVPPGAVPPGHTYRARVRMQDDSGRWSRWSEPYQFTATPPAGFENLRDHLMITEIMYNPPGPAWPGGTKEDFEFIELRNVSESITLDLTGLQFTQGIGFDFSNGAITSLAPGAYLLVVKNLAAFESRYGSGLPVAGEWGSQNLSNGGERLTLELGAGVIIRDFEYDDSPPWPTAADGGGSTLVLVDPPSRPDHSLPESWRASDVPRGSPGTHDSRFAVWLLGQGATDPLGEAASGLTHAMAYALGADLMGGNLLASLPVVQTIDGGDGEDYVILSHRRRLDATEIAYQVECSPDLIEWHTGDDVLEPWGAPLFNGDGTETVRIRAKIPVSEEKRLFLRLKILTEP